MTPPGFSTSANAIIEYYKRVAPIYDVTCFSFCLIEKRLQLRKDRITSRLPLGQVYFSYSSKFLLGEVSGSNCITHLPSNQEPFQSQNSSISQPSVIGLQTKTRLQGLPLRQKLLDGLS